ncbi:hypothetical protein LZ554_006389 [Drepanopeziza brunnea f. sp. 'monogermtubi']|nr:hypothetical protein LZ554_006389 [Drepanopeziza brunnea f. sp. 'monogermtubi']
MMFINAIVAAAVLAASAVTAKNTIEICRNNDLVFCEYRAEAYSNVCVDVPTEYNNLISSFDTWGLTCKFYAEPGCVADSEFFEHNGKINALNTAKDPVGWDDRISSYQCTNPAGDDG